MLENYKCFGCDPNNPIGLKMQFRLEGETVVSEWTPDDNLQGWVGVLHGGIQATLMDEIASWWVFVNMKTSGVTSKMEVNLLKPVRMHRAPIILKAKLKEMIKNTAVIHVELFTNDGELCAESLMHYFTYPVEIAKRRLFYPGIEYFLPEEEE